MSALGVLPLLGGALLPGGALGVEALFDEAALESALGDRIPPDLPLSLPDALGILPGGEARGDELEGLGLVISSSSPLLIIDHPDLGPALHLPEGSHTLIFAYTQESLILSPLTSEGSLGVSAFSFASPVESLSIEVPGPFLGLIFEGAHDYITLEVPEGGLALGGMDFLGADKDHDGFGHLEGSGGGDCNDDDPDIHPGAEEIPYNGRDEDCSGGDLQDVDGDGQLPFLFGGADCDDMNGDIYPGAEEVLDGVDNNCNGRIDEGTTAYDDDRDGFSEEEGDCDDEDATRHPEGEEIPYDGIDQDCSGADLTDVDGDGFDGGPEGEDCNDRVDYVHPGATEYCGDGVDEDCDGEALACPTGTPTADTTPSPDPSPSPTSSPSPSPDPSPSPTSSPTPSLTSSPSPSLSPSPAPSPSSTPSPTQTLTPDTEPPTSTQAPEPTPTPSAPPAPDTKAGGCGDCGGAGAFLFLPFILGRARRP